MWSGCCFLLALQANCYIFFERSFRYLDFNLIANMDSFLAFVERLNHFIGNILLHTFLLVKLKGTLVTLCGKLDEIDLQLNRPPLSQLGLASALGAIWMFILVKSIKYFKHLMTSSNLLLLNMKTFQLLV